MNEKPGWTWSHAAVLAAVAVALVAIVLALAGCGPSVAAGEVVNKDHDPLQITTTYIVCGKSMCPQTLVKPESWELWVCEGDPRDVKRTCEWWDVSPERYEATNIGDQVTKEASA